MCVCVFVWILRVCMFDISYDKTNVNENFFSVVVVIVITLINITLNCGGSILWWWWWWWFFAFCIIWSSLKKSHTLIEYKEKAFLLAFLIKQNPRPTTTTTKMNERMKKKQSKFDQILEYNEILFVKKVSFTRLLQQQLLLVILSNPIKCSFIIYQKRKMDPEKKWNVHQMDKPR